MRRELGIIFQTPSFDPELTAEENIGLHVSLYGMFPFRPSFRPMPKAYRDRVEQLAETLGLEGNMRARASTF